jgi:hypothetical protein
MCIKRRSMGGAHRQRGAHRAHPVFFHRSCALRYLHSSSFVTLSNHTLLKERCLISEIERKDTFTFTFVSCCKQSFSNFIHFVRAHVVERTEPSKSVALEFLLEIGPN